MKKLIMAAAIVACSCSLAMAQGGGAAGGGGGAGSDVSTPQKSAPRTGMEKRDDAMKSGSMGVSHKKKHRKHKKMMNSEG